MQATVLSKQPPVDILTFLPNFTIMQKSSTVHYPISELIRSRRSIRHFSHQPLEQDKIGSLFEATRWAPSSTNEQPWFYIYATKEQPELWNKIYDCLNEGNKIWAKDAPLLIVSMARKKFTRYSVENAHAIYDLGGANSFLSIQAVELGLQVRQMAGFNLQKLNEVLNIPVEYELSVVIAVGYPGDPENLPENLRLRELAPRERYIQEEFVMNKTF
ncbi:MAG: nitroreductase [Azospira oryzae]|nr:nitroreductase [Cytophaga sp.]PZR39531.1 MAG: nitroreductase [Azospira oryzae]